MDFGDILDKWEKGRPLPAGKSGGTAEEPPPRRADPLTEWLRANPVYDKDAGLEEPPAATGERRRRLLRKRPDAEIDLHGLLRDQAWEALEAFFRESRRRGFEKVLVIHGKGNHGAGEGLLKKLTARFIENCPFAGESGHNPAAGGGSGVTWVILRARE
jgi:DNA-nicking Smr family endonuclease